MAGNRSRELTGDRGIGHDCVGSRCLSQPYATAAIRLLYGYSSHCPVDELPPQGHGDEGFRLPSSTPEPSEAPSDTFILSSGHPPSFFALFCGNAVRCDHDTYGGCSLMVARCLWTRFTPEATLEHLLPLAQVSREASH